MMKSLVILFCLLSLTTTFASSVLVIGDSHTAGPFGTKIHSLLSTQFNHVVTLGHSSSAAFHWVKETDYKLSGGKFNQMSINRSQHLDPNPTHWREKVSVPKLGSVLNDNAYHSKWKAIVGENLKADIVVIALGANDARTIANPDGSIRPNGYKVRKAAIRDMIAAVKQSGSKCIWIAPPNGIKKSPANQKAVYSYLKDAINSECAMMDSQHYKATGCDGVHFSCSSQRPKAIKWAQEAFQFIKTNI